MEKENVGDKFENKKEEGPGYYLMKDKTSEWKHLWKKYSNDGHPSYSPDKSLVVTDSYPSRKRVQDIKILKDSEEDAKTYLITTLEEHLKEIEEKLDPLLTKQKNIKKILSTIMMSDVED